MYDEERSKFITGALKVKHDCFAYDKHTRTCKALNELECWNGKCAFYKTAEQRCAECEKTRSMLDCETCQRYGLK